MASTNGQISRIAEDSDCRSFAPDKPLISLLDEVTQKFPDKVAVTSLHQADYLGLSQNTKGRKALLSWTFSELRTGSLKLATYLSGQGVGRESRIVALLHNEAEWALIFWAALRLGAHFVPLNPRLFCNLPDAVYLLEQFSAKAIFASTVEISTHVDHALAGATCQPLLKVILPGNHDDTLANGWTEFSNATLETKIDVPQSCTQLEDTVFILLTSGSESFPKACPHTNVSIGCPAFSVIERWTLGPGDVLCQHLPSFHIFSVGVTLSFWLAGAAVVIPSSAFDVTKSVEAICTSTRVHVPCVPTMIQALTKYSQKPNALLCSPFAIILGGAPLTAEIAQLCKTFQPERIIAGYGATECMGTFAHTLDLQSSLIQGDICHGRVQAGARARICEPGSRKPIYRGIIGELHLGGDTVIQGYLNSSPESSSCFYYDSGVRWMATGDQAYMDANGDVYLIGRYKDIIIRGGENISPVKIESSLMSVPGITSACVIGMPDSVGGEMVVGIVTRAGPNKVSIGDIMAALRKQLNPVAVPSKILDLQDDLARDSYPIGSTGKIQKHYLRQCVTEYLEEPSIAKIPSSRDLVEQLRECLATVTGLEARQIDPSSPIRLLGDSIVLIHYLSLLLKRQLGRLTFPDLATANTIQKQAQLIQERGSPQAEDATKATPESLGEAHGLLKMKDSISKKLSPLGFGWDSVEEVMPMTDYLKFFNRDRCRLSSWNVRIASIIDISISSSQLEGILRLWIERHPLLRATAVAHEDTDLYVIMRPVPTWLDLQILHGGEVRSESDVEKYELNNPSYDWVNASTGPLFKASILTRGDTSAAGMILHFHHSIFDGVTLLAWVRDLEAIITHGSSILVSQVPYRDFAACYDRYRKSQAADKDVDFHVNRIRGIALAVDALWPPQRAPSWFKGDAHGWTPPTNSTAPRVLLDGAQSRGTVGIDRTIQLPQLSEMLSRFQTTAPIIAKAACVLVNLHLTGKKEALFVGQDSGRFWPAASADEDLNTANPLDIDGPTMTFSVNRVRLEVGETVLQFLRRVNEDQVELSAHAHAPLDAIRRKLRQRDEAGGRADLAVLEDILHRQSFNWHMQQYSVSDADPFRMINKLTRSDLGFVWFPSIQAGNILHLNATWDDAQLTYQEVHNVTTKYMCAAAWLSDPANMNKLATECKFQGYNVGTQLPKEFFR